MTVKLRESSTLASRGAKRNIRLISEGQGSSGLYSGVLLERDGPVAFPAGTQIFFDHQDDDHDRGNSHSIRDLVGVTLTDAAFHEGALNAEAQFFSHYSEFVDEIANFADLSIEASGSVKDGVVESLHPSPLNAVSIVPRGGRDGKILELIESFRESGKIENVKPDPNKVQEDAGKDKGMTPEQITALAEALKTAVKESFTEIKESLVPAKPAVQETDAPSAADVAEALVVSGLPAEARTRVYENLKNDNDFAKAIENEKAYVDSIRESLKTGAEATDDTVVKESSAGTHDYKFGW